METVIRERTVDFVEDQAQELMRRLEFLSGTRGQDNLSFGQYRVMAVIHAHGSISVGSLGRLVGSAQSTTSEMAARLGKLGLITKVKDPDDGRVVVVSLTEQGRQLMRRRKKNLRESYQRLLDALEADERARFVDAMCAINDILATIDFE